MEEAKGQSSGSQMSIATIVVMNITAVVSLRFLPSEAEYGLGAIFYFALAAVVFLVPMSLVAAELATTYPEKGGVFRWVSEAYGPRWGFLAMSIVASILPIPAQLVSGTKTASKFLMVCALAAIGLNTSFASMKKAGIRPMIHGFIISALVVIVALLVEMGMGIV